ncbi:hypothetical protein AB1L88_01060 [Tautonia sp. JC769]|uniref:hypothetical protein n=1 Tax=Tautonia sp. JC769 TaxID=3232135 RepID=UPI003459A3F7
MLTVAPIWRVAALMIPLASLVGCDWLPVRRRIDPALYPVPARPDPALIRGQRKLSPVHPESTPRPTSLAGMPADRPVAALPELVPMSPEEVFGPPDPTPMLDAALVRAQAVETAVFDGESGGVPASGESTPAPSVPGLDDPFSGSMAAEPAQGTPAEATPGPAPTETVEVPPIPSTEPESRAHSDAIGPDPGPDSFDPTVPGTPIETEDSPSPEAGPEDQDVASSEHLPGATGGQTVPSAAKAEAVDARDQLLNRVAIAQAQGRGDDPGLWQTVMLLLAESESGPEADAPPVDDEPAADHGPAFRIARIAFCREVLGFDRIKPVDPEALEAGEKVLIYAEVEGVHYLPEADGHISRLSTTLEILDDGGLRPLWTDVLPVEDRCSRPRHDYFVGYRLALPESLPPGPYRLRVSQHDLLSGHEDAAETPFVIR